MINPTEGLRFGKILTPPKNPYSDSQQSSLSRENEKKNRKKRQNDR